MGDMTFTTSALLEASQTIWRDHFSLSGEPFSLAPDPRFLFLSEMHAEALAALKLGLYERRGLIVLTGDVGTGKTTLAYSLLATLEEETRTAYVANPLLSFDEILESALKDLGVEFASPRRLDLLEALNGFLRTSAEEGKTVALVIDESQNLADESFEQLRLLLNFESFDAKLLQIVLVGQPELDVRLSKTHLRQIADRIAIHLALNPLRPEEAREYIRHRLESAGGSSDIFTHTALRLVVRKSRGFPRRINILCHNALLAAYGKGVNLVDRSMVAEVVRELKGRRFSRLLRLGMMTA